MMFKKLLTVLRHRWRDASDTRRAIGPQALHRLTQCVTASEQRHMGELRICVEAGLPMSYLWRHAWHSESMPAVVRQRALRLFGKLGIWDTEHNNGVLIYLLVAERSIEIVADRGLSQLVPPEQWRALVGRLGESLHAGRFEEGLARALDEVSKLLEQYFPVPPGTSRRNELPNAPLLL